MPRFFFDVQDATLILDEEGLDFANAREAAKHALEALTTIAAHEIADDQGLRNGLTVLVRDASGSTIYSATLSLLGTWLTRCALPLAEPKWAEQVDGSIRH